MKNFPNLAWFCGNFISKALGPLGGSWGSNPSSLIFPKIWIPIQALRPLPALLPLVFPGAWIESQLQRVRTGSGNSPAGNGAGPGPAAVRCRNLIFPALIPFGMGLAGLDFVLLIPEASRWLQRRILLWFPWNSGSSERCRNVCRSWRITSAAQSLIPRGAWAPRSLPDSSGNSFGMPGMEKQWNCSACRIPRIAALWEIWGLQLEGFWDLVWDGGSRGNCGMPGDGAATSFSLANPGNVGMEGTSLNSQRIQGDLLPSLKTPESKRWNS